MVGAAALIVTVIGIGIAILSFVGFRRMKKEAIRLALEGGKYEVGKILPYLVWKELRRMGRSDDDDW